MSFRSTPDGGRAIICETCHEATLIEPPGPNAYGRLLSRMRADGWREYRSIADDQTHEQCPACFAKERGR